jgi:hypothetical protein
MQIDRGLSSVSCAYNIHKNLLIGHLSKDILWWLSPFYHRFSLLLYLVLVSGSLADYWPW